MSFLASFGGLSREGFTGSASYNHQVATWVAEEGGQLGGGRGKAAGGTVAGTEEHTARPLTKAMHAELLRLTK